MRAGVLIAAVMALMLAAGQAQAGPFGSWVGLVIAGDHEASGGGSTEVFDNARHDIAQALIQDGFDPAHIRQFSSAPSRYIDPMPLSADLSNIAKVGQDLTKTMHGGCLFYFTSHGSPHGIVVDGKILTPNVMNTLITTICPNELTIVVVSSCYSGIFIPALAADNRMILTASRPDRASFGCGADTRYTFFDKCILQSLPTSHTFPILGKEAKSCVAAREKKEKITPPSDPQMFVGARIKSMLPYYTLAPAGAAQNTGPPDPTRLTKD